MFYATAIDVHCRFFHKSQLFSVDGVMNHESRNNLQLNTAIVLFEVFFFKVWRSFESACFLFNNGIQWHIFFVASLATSHKCIGIQSPEFSLGAISSQRLTFGTASLKKKLT